MTLKETSKFSTEEEGGYLELNYSSSEATTDAVFGLIGRTDEGGEGNEKYKIASTTDLEQEFGEVYNPWSVKDYIWVNGEWDAHLTGTVCRKFKGDDGRNLEFVGKGWDNLYNFKFWYTESSTSGDPAKVGSKSANQMLVLREPFILDPVDKFTRDE